MKHRSPTTEAQATPGHPLEYAGAREGRSAGRLLLVVARWWAVTPLVAGVSATLGYLVTRHDAFATLALFAALWGLAGLGGVPALVVCARAIDRRDPAQRAVLEAHASRSLLIALLVPVAGIVCFLLTVIFN